MPFKQYDTNYEYLFQVLFEKYDSNFILIHNQEEFEECFGKGNEVTFPIQVNHDDGNDIGTGADGNLNVSSGTTTLNEAVGTYNYNNVTIAPGCTLDTRGCIIRIKGILLNEGKIVDLYSGGRAGAGGTGGTKGTLSGSTLVYPGVGAVGSNGGAVRRAGAGVGGPGGGGGGGGGARIGHQNYSHETHQEGVGWKVAEGGVGGAGGAGGIGGGVLKLFVNILDNRGELDVSGSEGTAGSAGTDGIGGRHWRCSYTDLGWLGGYWTHLLGVMHGGGGGAGGGGAGGSGGTVSVSYRAALNTGTVFSRAGGEGEAAGAFGDRGLGSGNGSTTSTQSGSGGALAGAGGTNTDGVAGGAGGNGGADGYDVYGFDYPTDFSYPYVFNGQPGSVGQEGISQALPAGPTTGTTERGWDWEYDNGVISVTMPEGCTVVLLPCNKSGAPSLYTKSNIRQSVTGVSSNEFTVGFPSLFSTGDKLIYEKKRQIYEVASVGATVVVDRTIDNSDDDQDGPLYLSLYTAGAYSLKTRVKVKSRTVVTGLGSNAVISRFLHPIYSGSIGFVIDDEILSASIVSVDVDKVYIAGASAYNIGESIITNNYRVYTIIDSTVSYIQVDRTFDLTSTHIYRGASDVVFKDWVFDGQEEVGRFIDAAYITDSKFEMLVTRCKEGNGSAYYVPLSSFLNVKGVEHCVSTGGAVYGANHSIVSEVRHCRGYSTGSIVAGVYRCTSSIIRSIYGCNTEVVADVLSEITRSIIEKIESNVSLGAILNTSTRCLISYINSNIAENILTSDIESLIKNVNENNASNSCVLSGTRGTYYGVLSDNVRTTKLFQTMVDCLGFFMYDATSAKISTALENIDIA